ncbi:MAG: 2-hydroxychromene-2-carboxylate isomerase [Deltaproteobacteria bacterium]|nr:2-hydroxychromene-2-carboxylate isomerase [Deltaproteobacteria bacterium]MBW2552245.1 2-hydroxychromene-2-carboxylate isomerase [Deltaproteobacteria bacterium]
MSPRILCFHFDYISPYSYLAWCRIDEFTRTHDLRVEPRPTLLAALLNHLGNKGPGEIPERRAYLFKDCLRMAAQLNVPFIPVFSHPFNPLPSLRATLLDMDDDTRRRLVTSLFRATWAESRDVGSPDVVAEVCADAGVPDALARIKEPAVKQQLLDASHDAIQLGIFGVPTMIVDDELFWGNDSFPHLARYLAGDDPVRPEDVAGWEAVRPSAQRE